MKPENTMVIAQLGLKQNLLVGETVLVTGAGGGIGYETARSLLWLGANVIITEINQFSGSQAAQALGSEFGVERVLFVQTDVGDEAGVQNLYAVSVSRFGKVDAVLNTATIAMLGEVKDLPIEKWDASYHVNPRGPVLMARTFLPWMVERKHGVFVCVSSTEAAYLGGYETFKAAQVHLANTLDAEFEGSGVIAYMIGPGLVPTETATRAVAQLAPLMGMSLDEFYTLNKNAMLSIEEAGAGFAASIVFAEKFRGQEISSMQALKAANIQYGAEESEKAPAETTAKRREQALELCTQVYLTLKEQSEGWKQRSIFERQWVIRDFKKTAGLPVYEWLAALRQMENELGGSGLIFQLPLDQLAGYYNHLAELSKRYENNPAKLEDSLRHVYGWKDEVEQLRIHLT